MPVEGMLCAHNDWTGFQSPSLRYRKRASTYKELLQREERQSKLGSTVAQMELEKAVMVRVPAGLQIMELCVCHCCRTSSL